MDNAAIVREFFALWGQGDMLDAFEKHLAEDAVWHNSGLPTCNGRAECIALARSFTEQFPVIDVEFLSLAAQDDLVLGERIDRCKTADGVTGVEPQVNGAMRLADGKITYWYDYFDPRPFLGPEA